MEMDTISTEENLNLRPAAAAAMTSPTNAQLLTYPATAAVISQNKSYGSLELIKMALVNNELFQNVEPYCINHIAEKMDWEEYLEGDIIIQETSPGGKLYVVEYGLVQVLRNGTPICYLSAGKTFGELALFYNWQHTVTFKAASPSCHLWALDGGTLQQILQFGWKRHTYVEFMNSLPLCKHLPENKLIRLSWQIGEKEYMHGEYIIRQGTHATNFFVIQRGHVKVTIKEREDAEKFVRVMHQGEFFGEKALLNQQHHQSQNHEDSQRSPGRENNGDGTRSGRRQMVTKTESSTGVRTANVIVDDKDGVTCLVIDRDAFYQFFRGLEQQVSRRYVNE